MLKFLDVGSRGRLRSRARRHVIAAICSTVLLATACVLGGRLFPAPFAEFVGQFDLTRPHSWPWLVLSAPLWLCFPYALSAEWIRRRRKFPAWLPPLMLVPMASLVWSTLIGESGEYQGFVSLIAGLPIGAAVAGMFCTYWVPLLAMHRRSARHSRNEAHEHARCASRR